MLEMIEDDPEEFTGDDGATVFPLEFAADFFTRTTSAAERRAT